jgi:hypothetical protein
VGRWSCGEPAAATDTDLTSDVWYLISHFSFLISAFQFFSFCPSRFQHFSFSAFALGVALCSSLSDFSFQLFSFSAFQLLLRQFQFVLSTINSPTIN